MTAAYLKILSAIYVALDFNYKYEGDYFFNYIN